MKLPKIIHKLSHLFLFFFLLFPASPIIDLNSFKNMKGYIQNQTIILQDSLPDTLHNGDEVEIVIIPIKKRKYHFPTFKLDIKAEYLDREKIYEQD